jgi:phage terminase large subunit-like protein
MTVRWLKRQMEKNHFWRQTFGLEIGSKWTDEHIEINHTILGFTITILGFGLVSSHRGINIDDWRPDFIDVDDILDEENTANAEQRLKAENLVLGSLMDSLAPATEGNQPKLLVKQTPFHPDDFSMKAMRHPLFVSYNQGCWTKETAKMPLEFRESVWPQRFPSDKLRLRKIAAIAMNKGSLFSREMECELATPETSDFKIEWLKYYEMSEVTEEWLSDAFIVMAIDPVPPPSDRQIATGLKDKDFEAIGVVAIKGLDYYVLEYAVNRGHVPSWTIGEFFRMAYRWRPRKVMIESVGYQRTLSWLIANAMQTQRYYIPIEPFNERLKKPVRVAQTIAGPASHGHFYVRRDMHELIDQFTYHPQIAHDDIIDMISMAMAGLKQLELSTSNPWDSPNDMYGGQIEFHRGAP